MRALSSSSDVRGFVVLRWSKNASRKRSKKCWFRRPASSSSSSSNDNNNNACAVVLGDNADDLRATGKVVKESLGGLRVIMIKHGSREDGLTEGASVAVRRVEEEEEEEDALFEMSGASGETAAVVALDPTGGLIREMGLSSVLCVVGVARDVSLGEDMYGSRAVRAARRAAVVGVPTVVVSAVTRSNMEEKIRPALRALEIILKEVKVVISIERAKNCPRSHFPFPTNGRWASLGTSAFPIEDEALSKAIFDDDSGSDFASKDAWSFGGSIAPQRKGNSHSGNGKTGETPERRRKALRDAFEEGDIFLHIHVPPNWKENKFQSTRPGVLWRQQRVTSDTNASNGGGAENKKDAFGRTLPMQSIAANETRADESGASFVRQLATEAMVAQRRNERENSSKKSIPVAFKISSGTVVADDSHRGDLDAISKGFAAISAVSSWPQGHAFALLDDVLVESLREETDISAGTVGLPSWLVRREE